MVLLRPFVCVFSLRHGAWSQARCAAVGVTRLAGGQQWGTDST